MPLLVQAQAVESSANKFADPAAATLPSPAAGVAQSLLGLLLVLGILFAATWALRRFKLVGGGAQGLQVLQGVSLGSKERAVVVRVQGRRLLLGVASGQVSLLAELRDEDDVGTTSVSDTPQAPSFKSLLKRSLGVGGNKDVTP